MRWIFRLFFLALIFAAVGYFLWPGLSLYQIYQGAQTGDKQILERKVDWPSVRASFKSAIAPQVEKEITRQAERHTSGADTELAQQLSATYAPQVVDQLVETYMTPDGLVLLYENGGRIDMRAAMAKMDIVLPGLEKEGGVPGFTGKLSEIVKTASDFIENNEQAAAIKDLLGLGKSDKKKRKSGEGDQNGGNKFGIDNIKAVGFNSLTELEISVAKKAKNPDADVTAVMSFSDFDWKLTKLVPHF